MTGRIRDILLDDDGDIVLERGEVVWLDADDPRAIVQAIRHRLTIFRGEWYLDQRIGFPWFQEVLGRKGALVRAQDLVRQTILDVAGVREVLSVEARMVDRHLAMDWTARFDDGRVYSSTDFARPFVLEVPR